MLHELRRKDAESVAGDTVIRANVGVLVRPKMNVGCEHNARKIRCKILSGSWRKLRLSKLGLTHNLKVRAVAARPYSDSAYSAWVTNAKLWNLPMLQPGRNCASCSSAPSILEDAPAAARTGPGPRPSLGLAALVAVAPPGAPPLCCACSARHTASPRLLQAPLALCTATRISSPSFPSRPPAPMCDSPAPLRRSLASA